ncbi:hypothetical protein SARC_10156 [Sphaeroforma arctica JP610]|uniref:Uncharacterized protein n=1 Tax=Sphaeroforma arctica JP610 TaxID=667725 RepID=A0A0L0FLM1_9EUKA|nr:hypothetical protein SARC_10156 [Sphaeroforma arctica JP610]KNC77381.1 hypothetical protein SARC_10156 [Sphaeroforma arctica JP610]|eukprot:XP_014151283.1 hypothetical protein SARC_10156 [Sphaeroforma arctica JP610]
MIQMINAKVGTVRSYRGVTLGSAITVDPNTPLAVDGGTAELELTNVAKRVLVGGGDVVLGMIGNATTVTVTGGGLTLQQTGDTFLFAMNGGTASMAQIGTINKLRVNGGSVEFGTDQTTIEDASANDGEIINSGNSAILRYFGDAELCALNCPQSA